MVMAAAHNLPCCLWSVRARWELPYRFSNTEQRAWPIAGWTRLLGQVRVCYRSWRACRIHLSHGYACRLCDRWAHLFRSILAFPKCPSPRTAGARRQGSSSRAVSGLHRRGDEAVRGSLVSDDAEVSKFVKLYAMLNRMRVLSSPQVIETAEKVIHLIAETYFGPNLTMRDLRGRAGEVDILRHFSDACREDLKTRGG